mmetsp:Transcript_9237/g.13495  ORF Transcript_9237/g.13495 Transcript_9237/m.13495 type:complete len:90 (-) Transcript_9237:154-423(-)
MSTSSRDAMSELDEVFSSSSSSSSSSDDDEYETILALGVLLGVESKAKRKLKMAVDRKNWDDHIEILEHREEFSEEFSENYGMEKQNLR